MKRTNRKRLLDSIAGSRPARIAALASMCFAASAYASAARAADAHAPAAHPKMVLSAYVDAAQGWTLLTGHYATVIAALGSHGGLFKQDELAASTNLCVAYIMMRKWSEAHPACDEAIRFAKLEVVEPPQFAADDRGLRIAVGYSNRAVLEWLEERSASAADDLMKAQALAPYSEFVAQNLARLHAPLTTAGADSSPHRRASAAATAAHG